MVWEKAGATRAKRRVRDCILDGFEWTSLDKTMEADGVVLLDEGITASLYPSHNLYL
jgi:hypothetical protein